jgi:hypothetical protein
MDNNASGLTHNRNPETQIDNGEACRGEVKVLRGSLSAVRRTLNVDWWLCRCRLVMVGWLRFRRMYSVMYGCVVRHGTNGEPQYGWGLLTE